MEQAIIDQAAPNFDLVSPESFTVTISGTGDSLGYIINKLASALKPVIEDKNASNRLVADQLILDMCARLEKKYCSNSPVAMTKDRGLASWQQRRAKESIQSHITDGISVIKLAQECSFSRCHFSRAFKLSIGMSPHQYLLKLRVDKAKQLLDATTSKITDIALECGFADSSHLSKVFTRYTGVSPTNWRKVKS